ncbi:helix-turn-helix transcriptional regulator [Pontixanthobacter aquaemixtae]|uniref:HTH luxR-type domain-containing protein n=1 Tax=Pontixanthobacter aquaemixtae TaxID=1958940 RepID=A0A845A2H4_9SPHN|nr:LuxR C-terminal-related transcriptional regulator [Pontixanthobacter aquaemixtae]MXO91829.1 hypothetical protein [Pontixanthobacter aquaemixtae]
MTVATAPSITDRQRDVLERIDRRVPIKVIAAEMGVSDARINQHIRALKDKFEVESMGELVELYRATPDYENTRSSSTEEPYRNSLYRNSQLPDQPDFPDQRDRVDPGEIILSDSHHVLIDAPWREPREPVVVPSKLDGDNAVLYRLAAMVGIAFGVIAMVVLVVTASLSLSAAIEGKAEVRVDETGRSY